MPKREGPKVPLRLRCPICDAICLGRSVPGGNGLIQPVYHLGPDDEPCPGGEDAIAS